MKTYVSCKEIENLNRLIFIKEIETIINNLLKQKTLCPHGYTGKLYKKFGREFIPILYKLF